MYTEKEYKKLEKLLKNYDFALRAGEAADDYLLKRSLYLTEFVDSVITALNELMEKIEGKKKKFR